MISIFICTYNPNYNYLKRTVESILRQDLPKNEWEFVIIDNNSKTPVSEIDFIKELNIKVVVEEKQGLTAARGCAAGIANGNILVFADDDNILQNNYLTSVKVIFEDEKIGIISGNILPEYEKTPEGWFFEYEGMLAIRRISERQNFINADSIRCNDYFHIGAGMAIRKEIISEYYNAHLSEQNYVEGRRGDDLSSSEDVDLDYFALYKGYKIGVSPLLNIVHIIPEKRTTSDYILRMAKGNLKSLYLVNKKWVPVFKQNLFDVFRYTKRQILLRIVASRLLSFKKNFSVKLVIFIEIKKYLFEK